jgi:hypothetical protein
MAIRFLTWYALSMANMYGEMVTQAVTRSVCFDGEPDLLRSGMARRLGSMVEAMVDG